MDSPSGGWHLRMLAEFEESGSPSVISVKLVRCHESSKRRIKMQIPRENLTGKTFDKCKVVRFLWKNKQRNYYLCQCLKCGDISKKIDFNIKKGQGCRYCDHVDGKGCIPEDLTGKTYGNIKILDQFKETISSRRKGVVYWRCQCQICGDISIKCSGGIKKEQGCRYCNYKTRYGKDLTISLRKETHEERVKRQIR